MVSARHNHTATLLSDGTVLVAGGGDIRLAVAELYDPATGTFRPTGALAVPRLWHKATSLRDGRVLVVGGAGYVPVGTLALPPLASAEVYDAASGTFSETGSMAAARKLGHTATALPDGRVLIAGGVSDSLASTATSAEVYDPATGTFSSAGKMTSSRQQHTATLLLDGKVLLAGGDRSGGRGGYTDTAELYDPAIGAFHPTGSMVVVRSYHTATLLRDGRVLVAGGVSAASLSSAELYDPATGTFTSTGGMGSARNFHSATALVDGSVLIVGGTLNTGSSTSALQSAELYNPATGTFSAAGAMTEARFWHTATFLPSGDVLIAGGTAKALFEGLWNSAELYCASGQRDPGDDTSNVPVSCR
jgi:hypothetical protein